MVAVVGTHAQEQQPRGLTVVDVDGLVGLGPGPQKEIDNVRHWPRIRVPEVGRGDERRPQRVVQEGPAFLGQPGQAFAQGIEQLVGCQQTRPGPALGILPCFASPFSRRSTSCYRPGRRHG